MKPKILILDEPTTDLDPEGKRQIARIVNTLQEEGTTILLVSLEMEDWDFIKRAAFLRKGELILDTGMEKASYATDILKENGIRPSSIVELLNYLKIPFSGLSNLSIDQISHLVIRNRYKLSEERYETLWKRTEKKTEKKAQEIIRVRDLTYSYPNGPFALKNIDLTVKEGEFLAIIGANGSGKTTLLKHLKGIITTPGHEVLYRGQPIKYLNPSQLAAAIGLVFQNPDHQIFNKTVWEELTFGPRNFRWPEAKISNQAYPLLEVFALKGCEGMDPALLTKGERQKLALASILIMKPEVLILDEPTTGLDYLEQREIMNGLAQFNHQGHTVIIVTHALWVVSEYAHRAVVMRQGEIIYDGSVRNLFASPQILQSTSLTLPELTKLGLASYGKIFLSLDEWLNCLEKDGDERHF